MSVKLLQELEVLLNLDREIRKEDKEDSEHEKPNFLKVIDSFFNSTKKTQWQEQGEA